MKLKGYICICVSHFDDCASVLWNPSETDVAESVVTIDENNIRHWKLDGSSAKVTLASVHFSEAF